MVESLSAHMEGRALCLAMQLGRDRLLQVPPLSHWQPFQEVTNQRLTEEDTQIGVRQKGEPSRIHTQLSPQTRVRTRTRMQGRTEE